jgi:zinc transporter ZupT
MYITLLVLFIIPLCTALLAYARPAICKNEITTSLLAFGGSYLLSFIAVHLLPELFLKTKSIDYNIIGMGLAIGFFFQTILDLYSTGVAHGHVTNEPTNNALQVGKATTLLLALSMHALLEGFLLNTSSQDFCSHYHHELGIAVAILLHKVPVSFVLTTTLIHWKHSKKTILLYMLLFSMATPIGWLINYSSQQIKIFSLQRFIILRAVAIGNLLHIATTILSESNPEHNLNNKKIYPIILGALLPMVTMFL